MKKLLSVALAVVLVASLAACQSRDKPKEDDTSSSQSSSKPVENDAEKKAKDSLIALLKEDFGKEIQATYKEKVKIGGSDCFLFEVWNDNTSETYIYNLAITADGKTIYEKAVGGENFLKLEPMLSPAGYYIERLNNEYAASCVAGINALGNDIKAGNVATYPQDFPDKAKFPKISDTEDVTFLYKEGSDVVDGKPASTFVRVVVKLDDTHAAVLQPSMLNASDTSGKVTFTAVEFVKDYKLEDYAKKLDCKTRVGKNVK